MRLNHKLSNRPSGWGIRRLNLCNRVELIDMGMIECKHGWDLHAMGNVRQGSGGTEWTAVYNDELLIRFTAM